MVDIQIEYIGQLGCRAVHGPSGSVLQTDAPVDNRGRGLSFSPTDLMATAFGSCMVTIMAMRAEDLGIDLTGTKVNVKKIMTREQPRRIAELVAEFRYFHPLTTDIKSELEKASCACPVCLSISDKVKRTVSFLDGE